MLQDDVSGSCSTCPYAGGREGDLERADCRCHTGQRRLLEITERYGWRCAARDDELQIIQKN